MNTALKSQSRVPARLAIGTLVLALAGGLTLTANAAPGGHGGHGGPGAGHTMGGHGQMGEPGAMGHRGQMGRMLDGVGATAEQKAQVQQIMQAAAADMKSQREAGRALREQQMALLAQPTIDARAAEALRQKMLAQHDQASKRRLQAMVEAANVLTPDQRQQLAAQMTQRRSMMERHRAERMKLDKQPA